LRYSINPKIKNAIPRIIKIILAITKENKPIEGLASAAIKVRTNNNIPLKRIAIPAMKKPLSIELPLI
jgi:hypothetical protein